MPRHNAQKFPGLELELEDPYKAYLPGETISGHVIFTPVESDRVNFDRVYITFHGRSKSLIADGSGHGLDDFRGVRTLCNISEKIHDQDVPPMEKRYRWPFKVEIPLQPGKGNRWGDEWKANRDFLSTEDMSGHMLPSTFNHSGGSGFHTVEAYIEYFLKAELHERDRFDKNKETILPITLRQHADAQPVKDLPLASKKSYFLFKTTKFLPENQQPSGKREKLKYLVKSSKVPTYGFHFIVDAPTEIQLDHPDPIPFRICRVHTSHSKEHSTIDTSHGFPSVRVKSILLQLKHTTIVRVPAIIIPEETREIDRTIDLVKKVFKGSDKDIGSLDVPFVDGKQYLDACNIDEGAYIDLSEWPSNFPTRTFDNNNAHSSDAPPPSYEEKNNPSSTNTSSTQPGYENPAYLDLGRALDLHLLRQNAVVNNTPGWRFLDPVYEDFKSYNISHRHDLIWKIELECEGETESVEIEKFPVRVLAESEIVRRIREEELAKSGKVPVHR